MRHALLSGLVASGVLAWSTGANALLIDDFSTGEPSISLDGPAPKTGSSTGTGAGIIGGEREAEGILTSGDAAANATVRVVTSLLDIANTTTANSTVNIKWDGPGSTGLGGLDLTDAGAATGIFLSFPNPIDHALNVTFSINGFSTSSRSFPNGASGNDFFFPFTGFSNSGVFTSVNSIVMTLSDDPAWDAQIDFVETRPMSSAVPEPTSIALLGLGIAGLGALRSRRRN